MVACVNILPSAFAHSSVLFALIVQILYLPSQSKNNKQMFATVKNSHSH